MSVVRVLGKVKRHIKVKITVVCLWNSDFKLDYKQSAKITHIFFVNFTRAHFLEYGVDDCSN
jgi:hypothetical protein